MDSEPKCHTIDGIPWEEPRPPHLPDRLTSISPWVLPFLALAVFQVWLLGTLQPRSTDLSALVDYWLGTRYQIVGIAGALIGLALFLRHPNARNTLPQIASGAFLLLLAQVLGLLESTIDPLFVDLAPPTDEMSFFSPLMQAYSIFTSLVGIFAIAFIASGLSAARRYEDVGTTRGLAVLLAVLVFTAVAYTTFGFAMVQDDLSGNSIIIIAGALLANLFRSLALAYLVVVSVRGWVAQEQPRAGWRVAALGAGFLLLELITPFIGVLPLAQDGLVAAIGLIADVALVGWILLVVAFALGLPSTVPIPDDESARFTLDRPATTTPGSAVG